MNSVLFFMIIVNIWVILIKLGKWKTIPILLFYAFSFISVVLRLLDLIWQFTMDTWVYTCGVV